MDNKSQDFSREYTNLQKVIDIDSSWFLDIDKPWIGKRSKYHLEAPPEIEQPIIPCHEYIFKISKDLRQAEIWSEILASFVGGDMLELDVHRTYIGRLNQLSDQPFGVVMESFIKEPYFGGLPLPKYGRRTSLIHGGDILLAYMPNFDVHLGKQTCVQLIREATSSPFRYEVKEPTFIRYWASLLAFDMLINNGDRHHENWGMIPHGWRNPNEQPRDISGRFVGKDFFRFSPLFDNAGGFASEIDSKGLQRIVDRATGNIDDAVTTYASKGKPYVGFGPVDQTANHRKSRSYPELLTLFCDLYPESKKIISKLISKVNVPLFESGLELLISIDIGVEDSEVRAEFISKLFKHRLKQIKEVIK